MVHVYISMAYGDDNNADTRLANVRAAMNLWHELACTGKFAPYCPHLSHFLHEHIARFRSFWLTQVGSWVSRCDCVLMIGEKTEGMEFEEREARLHQIPVFRSVEVLRAAYGVQI